MRKFWFCILSAMLFLACDDGDIITVELDFDGELARCDNNTEDLMMYDVLSEPDEALILIFPRSEENELMFITEIPRDTPRILTINDNTVRFIYRTYNQAPVFCEILDQNTGILTSDNSAPSGTVEVFTTVEDFDNDGIPTALEDANLDGDDDPETNPTDSDNDGIPDYRDEDDDNDNVLTIDEDPDPDGNGDINDALDTDGDSIPNYLDADDDGDAVLTRLEDEDGNLDPTLDFDEESATPNVARYLNAEANTSFPDPGFINTSYTRRYTTTFTVIGVDLGVIRFDRRTYGTFETNLTIQNQ
jgi:hypothetical protein